MFAGADDLAFISTASGCAPVPQSRISWLPPDAVTSTHDVLPPKWFVLGPGVAIEPLVPQNRTRMPAVSNRGSIIGAWRIAINHDVAGTGNGMLG